MAKNSTKLDELRLLREQNELLREQIELLKQAKAQPDDEEIFIDNIDRDEIRDGFIVTAHRKKLWNTQLKMIKEFARICRKYNLRWFAIGGTLLGAARHKGFIPWDDDADVAMLRPDYEKFKRVAPYELGAQYFFDPWFNYKLEREADKPANQALDLQFVSDAQEKNFTGWWPFWPTIKIRDRRTTMIQWPERAHVNQGIWIDLFPYDVLPAADDEKNRTNFEIAREIFFATAFPETVKQSMRAGKKMVLSYEKLTAFMDKLTHRQRALQFEDFLNKMFFDSPRLTEVRDFVTGRNTATYDAKDFGDVTYLPFEKIEVPAPVGWENVLTARYGDWRKPVVNWAHAIGYSTDITYKKYFQSVAKRTPIIRDDRLVGFEVDDSENA